MPEWVSLRRFARERGVTLAAVQKAIESGRVTAVQRKPNGRLCAIDLVEGTAQWNARTDPIEAARSGAPIAPEIAPRSPAPGQAELLSAPQEFLRPAAAHPAPRGPVPGVAAPPAPADLATAAPASPPVAPPPQPPTASGADNPDAAEDRAISRDGYLEHRAKREEYAARSAEIDFHEKAGTLVSASGVRKAAFDTARRVRDQLLGLPDRIAATLAAERDPVRVHQVLTTELKRALNELTRGSAAAGGTGQPA